MSLRKHDLQIQVVMHKYRDIHKCHHNRGDNEILDNYGYHRCIASTAIPLLDDTQYPRLTILYFIEGQSEGEKMVVLLTKKITELGFYELGV